MAGKIIADTWENGDGTENFKCRAWVNFNGTGTISIRGSGNVSSITDGGTGIYTVNFATSFADTNYNVMGDAATGAEQVPSGSTFIQRIRCLSRNVGSASFQSYYYAGSLNDTVYRDAEYVDLTFFR